MVLDPSRCLPDGAVTPRKSAFCPKTRLLGENSNAKTKPNQQDRQKYAAQTAFRVPTSSTQQTEGSTGWSHRPIPKADDPELFVQLFKSQKPFERV